MIDSPFVVLLIGMVFVAVAIVGLGLIGGSLALAWRRAGYRGRIVGVSRSETLDEALALDAIDEGHPYEDLSAATRKVDLVVLAGPISAILGHIERLGADPRLSLIHISEPTRPY